MGDSKEKKEPRKPSKTFLITKDLLAETVIRPNGPCFCVFNRSDGHVSYLDTLTVLGIEYDPLSDKNLIGFVQFPAQASEYGDDLTLFADIRSFIRKWCELEERYEMLAALYAMYTWAYDEFLEVPYLRILADLGSGKSRLGVQVLGKICYKAFSTIAASTLSPLFRTLDFLGGTLILDESDLGDKSDKSSELVQMLNSGYIKGLPMMRSEISSKGHGGFRSVKYEVFGPKIIISRENFRDDALESRCLPIHLTVAKNKVPFLIDDSLAEEAESLRNKLLLWRFRGYGTRRAAIDHSFADLDVAPRLKQLLLLVSGILVDPKMKEILRSLGDEFSREHTESRSNTIEGDIALILCSYPADKILSCKEIADKFNEDKDVRDRKNSRSIAWYLKQRLGLQAGIAGKQRRSCVALSADDKGALMKRFGFTDEDLLSVAEPTF